MPLVACFLGLVSAAEIRIGIKRVADLWFRGEVNTWLRDSVEVWFGDRSIAVDDGVLLSGDAWLLRG